MSNPNLLVLVRLGGDRVRVDVATSRLMTIRLSRTSAGSRREARLMPDIPTLSSYFDGATAGRLI